MYKPSVVKNPEYFYKKFFNNKTSRFISKECVRIIIDGEDYKMCENTSHNRWSCKKRGNSYKEGVRNTKTDPSAVERCGMLGETALAKYTGCNVDNTYIEHGDKYDFKSIFGTYDIKCSFSSKYEKSRILYRYKDGYRTFPLKCDYYISAYIESENREKETATIVLVGYTEKRIVNSLDKKDGVGGKHENYEISYSITKPIRDILEHGLW